MCYLLLPFHSLDNLMGACKTCPRRTLCPLASFLVCPSLVSLFLHCWTQLHLTEMHRYKECFFSTEGRGRLHCRKRHSSEKSTSGSLNKHRRKQRASIKLLPRGTLSGWSHSVTPTLHTMAAQQASIWRVTVYQQVTMPASYLFTVSLGM